MSSSELVKLPVVSWMPAVFAQRSSHGSSFRSQAIKRRHILMLCVKVASFGRLSVKMCLKVMKSHLPV